jgi:hypothetical protein
MVGGEGELAHDSSLCTLIGENLGKDIEMLSCSLLLLSQPLMRLIEILSGNQ